MFFACKLGLPAIIRNTAEGLAGYHANQKVIKAGWCIAYAAAQLPTRPSSKSSKVRIDESSARQIVQCLLLKL